MPVCGRSANEGGKSEKNIHGIVPVMITPFHEDGDIDWNGLENLIEWYIAYCT